MAFKRSKGESLLLSVAVSNIMLGTHETLSLGNLSAKRDWGYAPEFVEGMWRMLQADKPDDYVLATNETHTIKEFVEKSFAWFGITIEWEGIGVQEIGRVAKLATLDDLFHLDEDDKKIITQFYNSRKGQIVVNVNPRYFRPTEVELLIGDPAKAKKDLGWEPQTTFKELVNIMVAADYRKLKNRKPY